MQEYRGGGIYVFDEYMRNKMREYMRDRVQEEGSTGGMEEGVQEEYRREYRRKGEGREEGGREYSREGESTRASTRGRRHDEVSEGGGEARPEGWTRTRWVRYVRCWRRPRCWVWRKKGASTGTAQFPNQ